MDTRITDVIDKNLADSPCGSIQILTYLQPVFTPDVYKYAELRSYYEWRATVQVQSSFHINFTVLQFTVFNYTQLTPKCKYSKLTITTYVRGDRVMDRFCGHSPRSLLLQSNIAYVMVVSSVM